MKSPFILRYLLALLFLFNSFSFGVSQSSDCKEIKAKVEVTNTTPGSDDGKIQVILENGPKKVRILLWPFGKDPKTYLSTLSINNLGKGKYVVVVGDENYQSEYCPRTIEVNVK